MLFRINLLSVAVFQYAALVINLGLQFTLTYLVAPHVFGNAAKLQLVIDLFIVFLSVGLHTSVLQLQESDTNKLIKHILILSILQAITLTSIGILTFLSCYFLKLYSLKDAILSMLLLFTTAFGMIKQVIYVIYERKQAFLFNSKINFYLNICVALPTILLAWQYPIIEILIGRIVVLNFLSFIIYAYLAIFDLKLTFLAPKNWNKYWNKYWNKKGNKSWDKNLAKQIIHLSFRYYLARLLEALQTRIDIIVISYLFDNQAVGVYERIKYYSSLPQGLLNGFANRINTVQYRLQSNINLLYHSHTITLLLTPALYFVAFCCLFSFNHVFSITAFDNLFPLYFCFWGFAGLTSLLDTIRTYLQIHHAIIRTTLKIRFVPLLFFLLIITILPLSSIKPTIYLVALLSSFSYLAAFIVIKPYLYWFNYLRFVRIILRNTKIF